VFIFVCTDCDIIQMLDQTQERKNEKHLLENRCVRNMEGHLCVRVGIVFAKI